MDPKELIFKGLIPGMDVVGEKFRRNEYYVPQVLLSARAMYAGLDLLKPLITAAAGAIGLPRHRGRDRHRPGRPARHRQEPGGDDAGGRRLQGVQPGPRRGAREVRGGGARSTAANIVGISALMTTTMPAMKRTIDALDQGRPAGAREGDDRRRAGEPGLRRRDRRRRLRQGLDARGGARPRSCWACRWPRDESARGWEVVERVRAGERLVFDGGYGTMLFAAGLLNGACPELWNDTHAEVVAGHPPGLLRRRLATSSRPTPSAAPASSSNEYAHRRPHARAERQGRAAGALGVLRAAAAWPAPSARRAACPLEYGARRHVDRRASTCETFREQAEALAEGGVDLFAVETMMFPQEATAAIRACKAVTDLPVMATMFFQYEELHDRDRTMWGESPAEVAKSLLAAGADVVGHELRARARPRHRHHPRDARGHRRAAGRLSERRPAHHHRRPRTLRARIPRRWPSEYPALLDAGCNIVGACCGSDPEHIRLIAEVVRSRRTK